MQSTNSIPIAVFFVVTGVLIALTACGPEPVYDDDLGLQAVAVDEGALAGTFVHKTAVTRLAEFPVVGPQETGGDTYFLVERTAIDGGYEEVIRPCGGITYPTPAGESTMPHESFQSAEPIGSPTITIDHARGSYALNDYVELWGLRDLPDPVATPLPADGEEAKVEPHQSRIWDGDDDGAPGITSNITGVLNGEVYFVQRRKFDWEGLTLSENRMLGLVTSRPEKTVIGASEELLNEQFTDDPHPDPKEAWWEQVRIADGATCDDVLVAIEDEVVSRIRPF